MTTLFISDLHLCKQRPVITELFIDFLEHEARDAEALYILGDLFEYWIGDEAIDQPEYRPVIAKLSELTRQGTPVYVMHGNRDFLIGEKFVEATGCQLLGDFVVINLVDDDVLLMHGDTLGIDDKEYLKVREMVRSPEWQQDFLTRPVEEREQMSQRFREDSKAATASKKAEIMDSNQNEVERVMQQHKVLHLIHGHTHRPDIHNFLLNGQAAERIVLGDWYEQGSVLRCRKNKWSLDALPLVDSTTA